MVVSSFSPVSTAYSGANPFRPAFYSSYAFSPVNGPYPSRVGLRIADEASQFWNLSSESGPDGGNLACAYMVNKILERVVGHKYGRDPDTVNSVRDDLLQHGGRLVFSSINPLRYGEQAQPGDLALSFNDAALKNIGGGTAHIGIFLTPSLIIANSSKDRRFDQIATPRQFSKLYTYFEIIRLPEAVRSAPVPAFSQMA
jgi:hypothetical protein